MDKQKNKKSTSNNKSTLNKKIYVDTPLRVFIIVGFIIIFIILSFIFLKKGMGTKTYTSLYYNEKSNLDYKVYLKPNPYFSEAYIGKGKQYIANLIDYIDVDFNYNFYSSDFIDYDYRYLINAEVLVYQKGETAKALLSKSYTMVPEKKVSHKEANSFNIFENLKINYAQYNNIVSEFKKDYSLSVEGTLKITLYVFMNGKYEKISQPLSSSQTMSLSMPLTEQTINIGASYKEINSADVVEEYSNLETINIVYFVLFGISTLAAAITAIILIRFMRKIRVKGTAYDAKLSYILKNYEGIVARVKKVPDFKDNTVIELESFDEILDISEKLDKPILFIEMHKHQKSWFLVVNHKEIYKFALKLVDLDKAEYGKNKKQ